MKEQKVVFEIERKRKLVDGIDELLEFLQRQGFVLKSENHEIDTYYSRPDVDYMETVECLRIRERDGFAELTYKPASSKSTSSDSGVISKPETNVEIKTPAEAVVAKQFLDNIGMVRLVEVNKRRKIFTSKEFDNLVVSLDEIKGLGFFIETEVMSSDKVGAEQLIEHAEDMLAIVALPIVKEPYRDLCMEAGL